MHTTPLLPRPNDTCQRQGSNLIWVQESSDLYPRLWQDRSFYAKEIPFTDHQTVPKRCSGSLTDKPDQLLPSANSLFLEDSNSAHDHKFSHNFCQKWRTEDRTFMMLHLSTSPDANLIGKCWRRIKEALPRRNTSLQQK
jgi:hypothetical protein